MLSCLPRGSQILRILVQPAKDSRRRDGPPRGYPGGYGPPGAYPPYGYPPPGYGRPAPRIRRGKLRSSLPSLFPDLKALTIRPHHRMQATTVSLFPTCHLTPAGKTSKTLGVNAARSPLPTLTLPDLTKASSSTLIGTTWSAP